MINEYDIIVIGAGHAGCEAARAGATMGSKVLLITMDMNKIAQMSCNPAMGGIAKGQIVREIDALGGYSGIITDSSTIQFRMLNRSKGPAMWSPRAQCDRQTFSLNWRYVLENTNNLSIWQDSVTELIFESGRLSGVKTLLGANFFSKSVIITAGTFLNGKLYIGQNTTEGGRVGEISSYRLSDQIAENGILTDRMKTGTPPRIDARTIDFEKTIIQYGDEYPQKFSFLNIPSAIQIKSKQLPCYIVHTNKIVHDELRKGFDLSPLFSGIIKGKGPRYCPSIEDKLKTFSDKDTHQLFLEPEGWNTNEYYLQGFSSSLPLEVQMEALRNIPGLENVNIFRPAYAVEYDYFPPTQLTHSLESKVIPNLYFAGQVNGTTGYEEAAAQGLMAGINAHLKNRGKDPFILKRDQAYIGVLIDDLVTKGVDEPYRMFTSRAEYRILLRQDNADIRLTESAYKLGIASQERMRRVESKYESVNSMINYFDNESVSPDEINSYLSQVGSTEISSKRKMSDILSRPQVDINSLLKFVPRGTTSIVLAEKERVTGSGVFDEKLIMPKYPEDIYCSIDINRSDSSLAEIVEAVEIAIKYKGYIEREKRIADKILKLEDMSIPSNFDYSLLTSLSHEARQKLMRIKPSTISQASRIPGVSPADISVLLIYFGR